MTKSGDENRAFEIWKPNGQVRVVKRRYRLSVQVPDTFRLPWTNDEWYTVKETPSATSSFRVEFVDIPITAAQRAPIRFTFFWPQRNAWEGRDYMVEVENKKH